MAEYSKPVLAYVDGWGITSPNLDSVIEAIVAAASAARPLSVFTLNLDHLVKLRRSDSFRNAYRNADIVTADGAPIVWLARKQNARIERTTGADMLVPLVQAAANAGLPIYLFGSTENTLEKSQAVLRQLTNDAITIVGARSPSANFDPAGAEAREALDAIEASGARICLVALGAPKQELFAHAARVRGVRCAMVGNGASLDFIAGAQKRAPKWLRSLGLEWTWRLALNPRRLGKRYLDCAITLADIVVLDPLRKRRVSN